MNFIRLGNSGLKISEITFGTALTIGTEKNDEQFAQEMIDKAWELGIRSFDVSNNYGMGNAEILIGKALSKYSRDEYVIATKGSWPIGDSVYHRGLSRKHIIYALENSLNRLQLDFVDIYYAHRYDNEVSMDEIVRTFNNMIETGKIRYWATSEWPVEALEECLNSCEKLNLEKPIVEQFLYSYAIRKAETNGVKSFCNKNNVGTLGFSPLAQGLLTGKYKNDIPKNSRIAKSQLIKYDKTIVIYNQNKEKIDKFNLFCEENAISNIGVALQWCTKNKIYPVLGASSPAQLEQNIREFNKNIPEEIFNMLINL